MSKNIFTKQPLTPEQQLVLLKERGLEIQDEERALCFLQAVSFFRLTPYMRPFQKPGFNHDFKEGAGFRQLSGLYDFDRRLRLLVIDAVERFEVGVRAHISNTLGVKYGSHWYMDSRHFKNQYHHCDLITYIAKKQQEALRDFNREKERIERLAQASDEHKVGLIAKRK